MIRKQLPIAGLIIVLLLSSCVALPQTPMPVTPSTPPPPPTETASPRPSETPTAVPTRLTPSAAPSGITLEVSPANAKPGDTVTIQGYLPGGPDQATAQGNETLLHANVCWQGCLQGLVFEGQSVSWSATEPGHFSIQFTVPAVPWVQNPSAEASPEIVQQPAPGDYEVGVQCLPGGGEQKGCALQSAQASATLHLTQGTYKACPNQACVELNFNPAQAAPGEMVTVSGWAPLDQVIGELAFGYSLYLWPPQGDPVTLGQVEQALDGSFTDKFVVPQSAPGYGTLQTGQYRVALRADRPPMQKPAELAVTSFAITGGLAWKDLRLGNPLWTQTANSLNGPQIGNDLQGDLTYCANGKLYFSKDGKTWSQAPATGPNGQTLPVQQTLVVNAEGGCSSGIIDPTHPGSLFAIFMASIKDAGPPPVYWVGYYSRDNGATWKSVPVPPGSAVDRFGGFWLGPQGVEALFLGQTGQTGQPAPLLAERTSDGAQTWAQASLACPAQGLCLRWGAAASVIGGMGAEAPQAVIASTDGGKTWSEAGPTIEQRAQGPGQLAAFNAKNAAVISGSSDFPFKLSQDGGATWQAVLLPSLPGDQTGQPFTGLQMLPDGSLLALPDGGQWMRLAPGAIAWCQLAGLPSAPVTFQAAGGQLWWLPLDNTQALGSLPLSAVKCK